MLSTVEKAAPVASLIVQRRRRIVDLLFDSWGARISALWLLILVVAAVLAPLLPLPSYEEGDLIAMLSPPSGEHWFGTDSLWRDILARSIWGGRVSLLVSAGSVSIGLLIGGAIGLVAGYFGGRTDALFMGVMTVMLSFPALILAIAIVSSLGPDLRNVVLAIGVLFIPAFARISRANTLAFRQREFVLAAVALGAKLPRILVREILPNLMPSLLSYALLMVAVAILAEAALGFLGLSVRPPMPSWGGMIGSERGNLSEAPHAVFMPALVMFVTTLAVNVLGERGRRLFDIKTQAL